MNTTIYPVKSADDGLIGGYRLHPIAYGMKAFDVGGHGASVPLTIGNPDAINVSAYATRQGGNIFPLHVPSLTPN